MRVSKLMKPADCMLLLGLGPAASMEDIKRAYRRLAQRTHPDKQGGSERARRSFILITQAYRTLLNAARAANEGGLVGACRDCGQFGEMLVGPDRILRCPRCILRPMSRRLLPLPNLTEARCIASLLLLVAAVVLLIQGMVTGRQVYAIGAFFCGLSSLAALACTCLNVVFCLTRREKIFLRKITEVPIVD